MMYRLKTLSLILLFVAGLSFSAQAQKVAVKTNIPYWFTATPNAGLEFALGNKISLELSGGVNPFKFSDTKQLKHWVVWPELRYWTCETFNGHFFGLHGVGGLYSLGGWDLPIDRLAGLKNHWYKGNAIGVGISYGYQWILDDHWGLEFTIGGGYARFDYEIHSLGPNGSKIGENKKNYFGPTKGGLSIVYIF
ncbi:MAG: DUF3575 domain-containing protein [Bacteroidia bacterium]|nr:DUF3575 domain-containing protein [Bacteroidia bacterium]